MLAEIRLRLIVWVALMALLALTVGLTFAPMGAWRLAASLGIAVAKAALVGWVFMELGKAPLMTRVVAIATLSILMVLILMSGIDAATRSGDFPFS